MNAQTALFARAIAYPSDSLLAAFRCWRQARDSGDAVQPSLFAVLSRQGHEILAPVLDSLLSLYETVLGRRLVTGEPGNLSVDEIALLGLLAGSAGIASADRSPASADGQGEGLAGVLGHALASTRFMLRLTERGATAA